MVCENHTGVVTRLYRTTPFTNLWRAAKAGEPHHMHDDDTSHPAALAENWQDDANCLGVDPDLFFPERGASTREAKEVCRGCVVREQCLEFALQNGEKFGIWGGLSERERRRIRRQRAQSARSIVGA
jgi:WhiB family transcriptional regulator, redox-sensing transcriptional regulator